MKEINKNLEEYIENNVLPQYDTNNVGGHGKEHIETVINRSFEIVNEFHLDVNKDMVYTIAAFHDIGYRENPDQHEEVSSEKFKQDEEMERFFNVEERKIIAEAIVDHRASLEYEARSIYGKIVSSADRETSVENMLTRSILYQAIVSSADRETSVENMLTRSILYQADKHKAENPSEQVIEYSYKKLSSKYGKGGYAKMYYPDEKYKNYLDKMQELLENKEKFIEAERNLAKKLRKV